jgi:hypothetical protein
VRTKKVTPRQESRSARILVFVSTSAANGLPDVGLSSFESYFSCSLNPPIAHILLSTNLGGGADQSSHIYYSYTNNRRDGFSYDAAGNLTNDLGQNMVLEYGIAMVSKFFSEQSDQPSSKV